MEICHPTLSRRCSVLWYLLQQILRQTRRLSTGIRVFEDDTYVLAAPSFLSTPSWLEGNESDYALDAGLWTACKESREVVKRHYKIEICKQERLKLLQSKGLSSPEFEHLRVPRLGHCRIKNEDMSFLVYPLQDLICFHIADKQHIGSGLYADDVRHYRPYGLPFWAAVAGHNDVVPQIAFEYDASWEFDNRVRNDVFLQEAGGSLACFLHALRLLHIYIGL